jgi:hypothetical protein
VARGAECRERRDTAAAVSQGFNVLIGEIPAGSEVPVDIGTWTLGRVVLHRTENPGIAVGKPV